VHGPRTKHASSTYSSSDNKRRPLIFGVELNATKAQQNKLNNQYILAQKYQLIQKYVYATSREKQQLWYEIRIRNSRY
jgi:hypothetical protein